MLERSRRLCIFVLSDRAMFRDCLVCFLQREAFDDVTGAATFAGLRRRPGGRRDPDLVLVDLRQDKTDPGRLLAGARARWPRAAVVALGTPLELAAHARDVDACLELPKARARDIVAIAAALEKRPDGPIRLPLPAGVERERQRWDALTARERQVLGMLAGGADNLKMAAMLGISERAVKGHVTRLFEKLGVENRTELALLACHAGLRSPTTGPGVPFRTVEDFDAAS